MNHIFLSYDRSDSDRAQRLFEDLTAIGFVVWLDKNEIRPGTRWQDEIRRSVRSGAAFLACYSDTATSRDRSYMREEVLLAIDELRKRPSERSWFIPVKFGACDIPDLSIGGPDSLRDLQYVDLSTDWGEGVIRIATALRDPDDVVSSLLSSPGSGDPYDRIDQISSALATGIEDPRLLLARARLFRQQGSLEEAADDFEASGQLGLCELAHVFWCQHDFDSAIAALRRFLRTSGDGDASVQAIYDLGCMYFTRRQTQLAMDYLGQAVSLRPLSSAARFSLCQLLLRLSRWDEVVEATEGVEASDSPDADLLEARGVAIAQKSGLSHSFSIGSIEPELWAEAIRLLDLAMDQDPQNARRLFRHAMLFFHARDYRRSQALAQRGLSLMPESTSFRIVLAQNYEYGSADKSEGVRRSAETYKEAEAFPTDDLQVDSAFRLLEDDMREPQPPIARFATIPLTIAGVAGASVAPGVGSWG